MRKIKLMSMLFALISVLILSTACNDDEDDNFSNSSVNTEAQTFWDEYNETITTFAVSDKNDLSTRLSFYDSYVTMIGSLTPSEVQAKINYVAPDSTTAVNFYNAYYYVVGTMTSTVLSTKINFYDSYKSIVGSLTPTQLSAKINYVAPDNSVALTFHSAYSSIVGTITPAKLTEMINFWNTFGEGSWIPASITTGMQLNSVINNSYTKVDTLKPFTGTILTLTAPFNNETQMSYGFITENPDDITVTCINASTKTKVDTTAFLVRHRDGFFLDTRSASFPIGTYIVTLAGTFRNASAKTYQPTETFIFTFTK